MFNKLKQHIKLAEEREFEEKSLDILIESEKFDSDIEELLRKDINTEILIDEEKEFGDVSLDILIESEKFDSDIESFLKEDIDNAILTEDDFSDLFDE